MKILAIISLLFLISCDTTSFYDEWFVVYAKNISESKAYLVFIKQKVRQTYGGASAESSIIYLTKQNKDYSENMEDWASKNPIDSLDVNSFVEWDEEISRIYNDGDDIIIASVISARQHRWLRLTGYSWESNTKKWSMLIDRIWSNIDLEMLDTNGLLLPLSIRKYSDNEYIAEFETEATELNRDSSMILINVEEKKVEIFDCDLSLIEFYTMDDKSYFLASDANNKLSIYSSCSSKDRISDFNLLDTLGENVNGENNIIYDEILKEFYMLDGWDFVKLGNGKSGMIVPIEESPVRNLVGVPVDF